MAAHARDITDVADALRTDVQRGLNASEARARLVRDGPNTIPDKPPVSPARLFVRQFADAMVLLLIGAAVVSLAIGETVDAAIILAIVVLNAAFGAIQDGRAQAAAKSVRALLEPHAVAIRDGDARELAAAELVRGDLVIIAAGDRVAADGRLVQSSGLEIDESVLTGESLPSAKRSSPPVAAGAPLPERETMAYAGTTVARGRGMMLITATAIHTEVGAIARLAQNRRPLTPLQQRLGRLAALLLRAGVAICVVLTIVFMARGNELASSLLLGVSLAVAAIPEGLAAVVTITLALGMRRLAQRGAIVRRLVAVETLGSTSVICADKTGTLTQNAMRVTRVCPTAGEQPDAVRRLLGAAMLASDPSGLGAEDASIATAAAQHGLTREELLAGRELVELRPFEAERRRASTLVREGNDRVLYVKGAPDTLLPRLADRVAAARLARAAEEWEADGIRVLCVARRAGVGSLDAAEHELDALGLVGLSDPPRETSVEAVRSAAQAGMRTIMVTGDEPRTARAIARACGLGGAEPVILTGATIDACSDEELRDRICDADVCARIAPAQKLRIVRALQGRGDVVAMTGDGVNDVPALTAADVGVTIGRGGTDAAIDAADVVLTDNDLSTILAAVREGRSIYANIIHFVRFLLSANAGEVLTFALAVLSGAAAPLTVPQILTVNLLTDGLPAVALGLDPTDERLMRARPRPRSQGLLEGAYLRLGVVAILTGVAAFAAFEIGSGTSTGVGQTMAFVTLVLAQLAYVFSVRTERPFWRAPGNRTLIAATALSAALPLVALAVAPLGSVLDLSPLSVEELAASLTLALLPLLGSELAKLIGSHRHRIGEAHGY